MKQSSKYYLFRQIPLPFHLLLCLVCCAMLEACTQYQHPNLHPRQLGWQPDRDLAIFRNTDSLIASLDRTPGARRTLDSLLEWTDMLKNYDQEAALDYANEAYRLAVVKGYRFSQAVAMYYRALLKGRGQLIGEGVEDALADARISNRLLKPSDNVIWLIKINGLLGNLYYNKLSAQDTALIDTAQSYLLSALEYAEHSLLPQKELQYLKGQLFLDLANLTVLQDSAKAVDFFQKSIQNAESAENQPLLAAVWRDVGNFFIRKKNFGQAAEALLKSEASAKNDTDPRRLVNTLQKLADLRNKQFYRTKDETYFRESMDYLNRCRAIQKENLYYTYLLTAYNYHDKSSFQEGYSPELDSAIIYYRLAMEEARKEGALEIMKNVVKHISNLCVKREELTGEDCSVLFTPSNYYLEFINTNYAALVDTMRHELQASNDRIRTFEIREQAASNTRRVNRNWLISGAALLIAGLIFLLLLQGQQQQRLQARMDALRAQINPHFISNSLNAIENLVNMDQREAAAKYLIHFSRLSRKILNSSRSATTSLAEELQTLTHFLALEQLRFRDKLNYSIDVATDLNPDLIEVPALILQPYVENAIWHGIKPKTEPSHLQIRAERRGQSLVCIIEDDGIGRARAQQAKSVLSAQHQSQGMKITEERLKTVGKAKGSKVDIIDLQDAEGHATGTRVVVTLPLKLRKQER